MEFRGGVTVTYMTVTVAGQDERGNDVYATAETVLPNCAFVPQQTSEATQGAEQVIGNAKIYINPPEGLVPTPLDYILYNGKKYQVDGDSAQWVSPFTGVQSPVMLDLREVTGASAHTSGGGN
jgi:hypothetical protein